MMIDIIDSRPEFKKLQVLQIKLTQIKSRELLIILSNCNQINTLRLSQMDSMHYMPVLKALPCLQKLQDFSVSYCSLVYYELVYLIQTLRPLSLKSLSLHDLTNTVYKHIDTMQPKLFSQLAHLTSLKHLSISIVISNNT